MRRLAEEQAALRRLATLAAEGAGAETMLDAVVREVGRALSVPMVRLDRFEPDGSRTTLARWPAGDDRLRADV